MALLLDVKGGKPIYLLRGGERRTQIAIEVDFVTKKPRAVTNAAVSAYETKLDDLKERIRRGDLVLLRGGLE
ncbi:MAG: hypothetical protein AB1588_21260 [Pseudomonadota bacterium]